MEDEQTMSAEERLKKLNEERKTLKAQVKDERAKKLELAAEMRAGRDEKIEKIQEKLRKISEAIYRYNKLGKIEKMNVNIFQAITDEIFVSVETKAEADGECQMCSDEGCEACSSTKLAN